MATLIVSSGVTSSALSVASGELVDVLSGGVVQQTTVLAGGVVDLALGGTATSATVVSAGGLVSGAGDVEGTLTFYGSASDASLGEAGQFSQLTVEAGGAATASRTS